MPNTNKFQKIERKQRLAAALRENLRRRKAQSRAAESERTSAATHFDVELADAGDGLTIAVRSAGKTKVYALPGRDQGDFVRFFDELSADFGTRRAENPAPVSSDSEDPPWRPLLTENIHPKILAGYGDPAVVKTNDGYYLTATSNDALDAFPLLHSDDLEHWSHVGFCFAEGEAPQWVTHGIRMGDFWAPEIVRVGGEYWLVYTARDKAHVLGLGLAKAASPRGPWVDLGRPLLTGGVIDGHVFVDEGGERYLFWKEDRNGVWPRRLAAFLRDRPRLIDRIFATEEDRQTARFAAAVVPWAAPRRPIERFFLMQTLIRAAVASWKKLREVLEECGDAQEMIYAMRTPIMAQRLSEDGESLVGSPVTVLSNELDWEGHLVEGPFLWKQDGRYWLFYAANDFTDPAYGIGVAVADHPLGPYVKRPEPLLSSAKTWSAPGHPSIAEGPDGTPHIFFHAYFPGTGGYNVFRALLTARLKFDGDEVAIF
ncbi:MAG TPA: glycoside hydrolase family 43 protein [Sphingomicrobium sp.]|nr:glycoside hydrolase family 43 protein [Sphingomicrobium sp.]